jgi:hypothetical protein
MKAKINIDNSFGGFYTQEFLETNILNVVNGQLVSEWILTDKIPSTDLFIPIFDNGQWIEGATEEDFNNKKEQSILQLKQQQFAELQPTDFYFIRNIETGVEIPQSVLDERTAIRLKYQELENSVLL